MRTLRIEIPEDYFGESAKILYIKQYLSEQGKGCKLPRDGESKSAEAEEGEEEDLGDEVELRARAS